SYRIFQNLIIRHNDINNEIFTLFLTHPKFELDFTSNTLTKLITENKLLYNALSTNKTNYTHFIERLPTNEAIELDLIYNDVLDNMIEFQPYQSSLVHFKRLKDEIKNLKRLSRLDIGNLLYDNIKRFV